MKVSFIGSGKVGTAFGKYVSSRNDVLYYASRTDESARTASEYVGCQWTHNLFELIKASEIIFITTSDNEIEKVCENIRKLKMDLDGKHFVHMSGAMTTDVFKSLEVLNATSSSLHPLQTFSSIEQAIEDLNQTYFSLESHSDVLIELIELMGNPFFRLSKEQKIKYHLSACIFSNYMVTLLDFGSRLLNDIGISEQEGLKAMKPLIDATLNNVMSRGPQNALTGPIQRGDTETLKKHMSELESLDLEVYKLLGKQTTEYLIKNQNEKDVLNKMWRLL